MAHELIVLGAALLLASLLARAGARVGLPTIPLFMAAGILVGPHTPGVVLFDAPGDLEIPAAFGLVFLMFYLGLEFSVDDLVSGGRRLLLAAGVYLALNIGAGLAFGFLLGWGSREAFVLAGVVGISSSAIVTKVIVELRRLGNPETRLILGIIVIEDVFLALYLAALAPVLGEASSPTDALLLFLRAAAFLVVLGLAARLGGNLANRLVNARDDELTVVSFVGIALLTGGVAHAVGVSEAIGGFMAGLVLGATRTAKRIERLVLPLRDTFAAVFFFAFGLSIDPGDAATVAGPVAAAVAMSVVLALAAGAFAARLHGYDRLAATNIGFTVLARGEFALILVSLAAAAGLDGRLPPFVALYVLVLAIASPVLSARSSGLARLWPARWFPGPSATATPRGSGPGDGPEAGGDDVVDGRIDDRTDGPAEAPAASPSERTFSFATGGGDPGA